jgi:hypothetical protein
MTGLPCHAAYAPQIQYGTSPGIKDLVYNRVLPAIQAKYGQDSVKWELKDGNQPYEAKKFEFKLPDAEGNLVTMKRLNELVHHILVNRLPVMEVRPFCRPRPLFVLVCPLVCSPISVLYH